MSQRNQHPAEPPLGAVVTYRVDTAPPRIAAVVGPVVTDPETGRVWAGVRHPPRAGRQETDLIPIDQVAAIRPPMH